MIHLIWTKFGVFLYFTTFRLQHFFIDNCKCDVFWNLFCSVMKLRTKAISRSTAPHLKVHLCSYATSRRILSAQSDKKSQRVKSPIHPSTSLENLNAQDFKIKSHLVSQLIRFKPPQSERKSVHTYNSKRFASMK